METSTDKPIYLDPDQPPTARSHDLIARMTIAEKVSQMMADSPEIPRLGVPAYNWWNEALHGVARAGVATVFPQAIGIAATWNADLVYRMADAISDEARAKHHHELGQGESASQLGLTFWSPNINIFRDPRWGRGQETYGEDPYLTATLGISFTRGLQGDHPQYLKTAACAKHFAVHSGPEADRHHFNARVSPLDLAMTYLPAFEALVREAKVAGVMGAYNRLNRVPCCANPILLRKVLRRAWEFDGYICSDCGAIADIYEGHQYVQTPVEAVALAVKAGCDLNCGTTYEYCLVAVGKGLLSERDIDQAVMHLFNIRFRLGMFDPPERVPYAQIPIEANNSPASQALALEVARQSLVLLKNEGGMLPLKTNIGRIAVIGPNADDPVVLCGNYSGTPADPITVLDGVRGLVSPDTVVEFVQGCDILAPGQEGFGAAVAAASASDVAVMVLGLSQKIEGEEGQWEGNPQGETSRGDRQDLGLPGEQGALLQAVHETGTPVALVLMNGSPLAVNWAKENVPAILEAWYPGQEGGRAVAEAIFGAYNPGGRLPVTFYRSVAQLPPFEEYAMAGRTYRYFDGEPLYPFGYGLSYTTFAYANLSINPNWLQTPEGVQVSCEVRNTGAVTGDEVVQVYLRDEVASLPVPRHTLVDFKRLRLASGASEWVTFMLPPKAFACANDDGRWMVEPGKFTVFVGGGQPGTVGVLSAQVELVGDRIFLDQ